MRGRMVAASTALLVVAGLLTPASASAFWSVAATTGSAGSATSATVNQGATPTASVATRNDITVAWAGTALSNGVPVTGYTVTRYSTGGVAQTVLNGCAGVIAATTCTETDVPDGTWTYRITPRFAANWTGAESAGSAAVLSDATAPATNNTRVQGTGGSSKTNNTVFYRGAAAGSFSLSNAVTDAGSGPASSTTGALTGTSTGFTHTPSTVSTPAGGPFVSNPISWTAGTTTEPSISVTGADVYGNTATTTIALRLDNTPPTGGAISYPNGTQRGTSTASVPITLAAVADAQSGLGSNSTRVLQRAIASLSGDTCGAFGGFANRVTDPAASLNDSVSLNTCIQYRYVFTDAVGNQTITTNPNIVKAKQPYSTTITQTAGIVDYYRLGGNFVDAAGNNNTGTSTAPPATGTVGAIGGDADTSVTYDGVNDFTRITRTISTNYSIEFWFKSTQGLGTGTQWYQGAGLVDAEVNGPTNDFGISLSADGRVMAGVGSANGDITVNSPAGFDNDVWHHVVMTRVQSTGLITLYVDGVSVGSATGSTLASTASANIDFGRIATGNSYYQGSLDEVALYSTALTAAQVQAHYLSGK